VPITLPKVKPAAVRAAAWTRRIVCSPAMSHPRLGRRRAERQLAGAGQNAKATCLSRC
jgi:hypothetical protein